MERPRLLLVPSQTELYWLIRPLLAEWADVASYDPPGVGREPSVEGPILDAIASRGLAELENRNWTRCVVVSDVTGVAAITLARIARGRVAGLALGHATLSYRRHGPRASLNPEVEAAGKQMMEVDYRGSVRQEVGIWDPRRGPTTSEQPPDWLVDRIVQRLPAATAIALSNAFDDEAEAAGDLEPTLRALGLPLLLAKHQDCVSHTDEGFDDAVAAFPDADTVVCSVRPSASKEFAIALREFCERAW
jgi:hypothetical protein